MEEKKARIAIIDLDSILYTAAWGIKIPDGNGDFMRDEGGRLMYMDRQDDDIANSINEILTDILEDTQATSYIAYMKGKSTGRHRYQVKPDYKANRPKEIPGWWDFAKSHSMDVWKAVPIDYLEADDAVNITRLKLPESFIVAIDGDLLHLEGTHYNWRTKEWISTSPKDACVKFWADMVAGQSGDGIKGLLGKGKSYYQKILEQHHILKMDNREAYAKLPMVILEEYITHYGEHTAIQEYYKNYTCLKMLEECEEFEIPDPVPYVRLGETVSISPELDFLDGQLEI